eukprot:891446-Rhodomonas_salina.1
MSSDVMHSSRAPGMSGYCGRPPTAIRMRLAVIVVFCGSHPQLGHVASHRIVCASTNDPRALMYCTCADRSPPLPAVPVPVRRLLLAFAVLPVPPKEAGLVQVVPADCRRVVELLRDAPDVDARPPNPPPAPVRRRLHRTASKGSTRGERKRLLLSEARRFLGGREAAGAAADDHEVVHVAVPLLVAPVPDFEREDRRLDGAVLGERGARRVRLLERVLAVVHAQLPAVLHPEERAEEPAAHAEAAHRLQRREHDQDQQRALAQVMVDAEMEGEQNSVENNAQEEREAFGGGRRHLGVDSENLEEEVCDDREGRKHRHAEASADEEVVPNHKLHVPDVRRVPRSTFVFRAQIAARFVPLVALLTRLHAEDEDHDG